MTVSSARLPLYRILQSQGFGTRRYCKDLVFAGLVHVNGVEAEDPDAQVDTAGLVLDVDGERWAYHARAYLMLHKPTGFECSQKPRHHPSVYTLLPVPLRERGVQCVGRLDQDTTGLLLLTDDGQFVHTLTSPRHQVPKVYEITTAEPVTDAQVTQLCQGVLLEDEDVPVAAAWAERADACHLRMALTQGKYHQVKRMVAAAGNHVAALHRSAIGGLTLGADLAPGQWRWLESDDLVALDSTPVHPAGAAMGA
ncbi:pseudouridine synthase [Ralstonia pseudosolanacearum]|uniref:pseudouridine synthase n=1 Tax=Ralstonia pseudosolanacearum TaxID=1310165 RepID=UPI0007D7D130|nr:16S rRNA pseudouridine(516) synthase [Ralstonia pseudosolanacearum]MDC6293689.1 16S rRNA pseudouridine(516) synthase [Ralstonia pseudosolanacearum]MDD7789592.1 16S rRNA pseudouridine(516) synthase [Ralstonia pseudosolanacearum]MDN3369675.1 16S rRNA pseudouridine(516) synthase [Ralstonia pseudosolanacearum]OAK92663.1 pseudouridine synthase [Ralstonia pseudosolanacearum]QOK86172.1 16S rRNA pseudouridine(516) synthase [Ralstonia pseudosolanacearum]